MGASAPLERASALDPRYYAEPEWLDRELAGLFRPGWQWVGTRQDLVRPGDYLAADLAGGSALVVVREDGALAAYHNICRHRAGPVARGRGNASRLRCLYHGWQYALDGRLKAAPEMGEACGFDPAGVALWPAHVSEFQGHVFVALSEPALPFAILMKGIAARIAPQNLSVLRFHSRTEYLVEANWKVYTDNYLEGYHVPYVHPALVGPIDYAEYRTETDEGHVLQYTPVADEDPAYGGGTMWYYWLWPNTMLNVVEGRLQLNQVIPVDARTTRVTFANYYTPEALARADIDMRFTDTVQSEDAAICAAVDRNLRSGVYTPGRLSPRREAGVWRFHDLLRDAYARA